MKILLANSGRIGDLILSTAVLPVLKKALPDCQIGFLASSQTKELVENHIHVDWVHIYDHPRVNPKLRSQNQKKREAKRSWKKAFFDIKKLNYDHGIDLFTYSREHTGPLFYLADIPRRTAYWRCSLPFFFNEILFCGHSRFHLVDYYGEMLRQMGIETSHLIHLKPTLEYKTPIVNPIADRFVDPFILIHMGSHDSDREWELSSWKTLLSRVEKMGYSLLFVGKGVRERKKIEEVMQTLKRGTNLCDALSLRELMEVVKRARLVLGVDSMAGHLTAAFNVPGLFIYAGYSDPIQWRPYSKSCEIMLPEKSEGKINRLQTITPEGVFDKVRSILEK